MKGLFLSKSAAGVALWLVLAVGMMCAVSGTSHAQDSEAPASSAPAVEVPASGEADVSAADKRTALGAEAGPSRQAALGVRLTDEEMISYAIDRSVLELEQEIYFRFQGFVFLFIVVFSALVFALSVFSFFGIRRMLGDAVQMHLQSRQFRETFNNNIEEHLTRHVDKSLGYVQGKIDFYHWAHKTSRMKVSDSINRKDRDEAMNMLRSFHGRADIIQEDVFLSSLEDFVDSLAAADQVSALEEIDNKFRDNIQDSPGIMQTYIQHYGMRVLGDADASEDLKARFRRYCDLLKNRNYYELALPYMMVYAHAFEGDAGREKIDEYIRDASFLQPNEKAVVARVILKHQDASNVARRVTGQVARLCGRFRDFFEEYRDRLESDVFPSEKW